jgi:hypothetical protein
MPNSLSFSCDTKSSKIKRAFFFFHCFARYALGINHRRSHIGMAMHRLGRTNIVIFMLIKGQHSSTKSQSEQPAKKIILIRPHARHYEGSGNL